MGEDEGGGGRGGGAGESYTIYIPTPISNTALLNSIPPNFQSQIKKMRASLNSRGAGERKRSEERSDEITNATYNFVGTPFIKNIIITN